MPSDQRCVYRFDGFELDSSADELRKAGIRLKIHPQPLRVLVLLLERPGEIVTRGEIQHCLWDDKTFVDFERGINFCVNQIRAVLTDSADTPRYIETVPRRGYRFIAAITRAETARSTMTPAYLPTSSAPVATMAAADSSPGLNREDVVLRTSLASVGKPLSRKVPALRRIATIFAVAILGVAFVFYFYSHRPRKLTEKDIVVLAEFHNMTGDPVFDDALKQGLAVELSESPYLNVLSEPRVRDTLKLMGRSPDERLTSDLAREVCQRAGDKAYLTGSISKLGSQYVIALNASDCLTGDFMAQEQVTANGKQDVLKMLDLLAARLREKVGESLASVRRFDTPLEQATTTSLEALEAYSLGRSTMIRGDPAAALVLFQRAARLDPGFAMAYAYLGNDYAKLGEYDLTSQNVSRAYQLREKISTREKFYIEAQYQYNVIGNLNAARAVYELWSFTYPRDELPVVNVGAIYRDTGDFEKLFSACRRALQLDPADPTPLYGLATTYLAVNRLEEAQATEDEAERRKLDSYRRRMTLYDLAFLRNNPSEMERQTRWAMGKPRIEDQFLENEALSAAYFGKMKRARVLWQSAIDSAMRRNELETAARYETDAALVEAEFGNGEYSRRMVHSALSQAGATSVKVGIAEASSRVGDSERAEKIANHLAQEFPQDTILNSVALPVIRAGIEMSRANPLRAIDSLRAALPCELGAGDRLYSAYVRGLAWLQIRNGTQAAAEFQKIIDHSGIVVNEPIGALAHLQLARAYAMQRDTAKARAEYGYFLALWRNADSEIPILKRARIEYDGLN